METIQNHTNAKFAREKHDENEKKADSEKQNY